MADRCIGFVTFFHCHLLVHLWIWVQVIRWWDNLLSWLYPQGALTFCEISSTVFSWLIKDHRWLVSNSKRLVYFRHVFFWITLWNITCRNTSWYMLIKCYAFLCKIVDCCFICCIASFICTLLNVNPLLQYLNKWLLQWHTPIPNIITFTRKVNSIQYSIYCIYTAKCLLI